MLRILTLIFTISSLALADDIIVLQNQSELSGKIIRDDGETLTLRTDSAAGEVALPYDSIATVNGLPATRLRSGRREAARAATFLARRGIPTPADLRVETLGAADWATLRRDAADLDAENLKTLAPAMARFRLAPADWNAAAGFAAWDGARRHAAWDPRAGVLRLLVPADPRPGPFDSLWIAAGLSPEQFPVTRESARASLWRAFGIATAVRNAPAWSDRAIAIEAAESGLAAALALDAALDPRGIEPGQGDSAAALAAFADDGRDDPAAPPFLRATRATADRDAVRFFRTALLAGGWRLALRVMEDLPASTEQILHPERYFSHRDLPTLVTLPIPKVPDGAGELAFLRSGELGEALLIESLLRAGGDTGRGLDEPAARKAAEGWDGDAWVIFSSASGEPALVWFSVWDSPEDALEFAEAEAGAAILRAGGGTRASEAGRILLDTPHGRGRIDVRGREVVAVESVASAEVALAFAEATWRDAKREDAGAAPLVSASPEAIATAMADTDRLAAAWRGEAPRADPISGRTDATARTWTAPGAFRVTLPKGWDSKPQPEALVLSTTWEGGSATVSISHHRLPDAPPPALAFAHAWRKACRDGGAALPYDIRTADGRGWFQFAPKSVDKRVHLSWAMFGKRVIRVEAVAPGGVPPKEVRDALQEMLKSVSFQR